MNNDVIGYYNPIKIVNKSRKDISTKELDKLKYKKEQQEAIAFIITFIVLTAFAIWTSHIMSLPY